MTVQAGECILEQCPGSTESGNPRISVFLSWKLNTVGPFKPQGDIMSECGAEERRSGLLLEVK